MSTQSKLIPISYYNAAQEVRLSAYADTIIFEEDNGNRILRAIRFGGYPEMVRALSDALYGGAEVEAVIAEETYRFCSQAKHFRRQISHDGVYAEAILLSLDDEDTTQKSKDKEDADQQIIDLPPRKCTIFCPAGDKDRLFAEIDRKTAVPLIPAFRDYLLSALENRGILKKLTVVSVKEKLDAWVLFCANEDANIIEVVEDGLHSGAISIPRTVSDPNGFDQVDNVTSYLNTFGVTVAQRIRNQFEPLFDPAKDLLSPEVLTINEYIREHAGYPLYDAQLAVAESVMRQLKKDKCAFIVAECGSGKSKIGATALAAAHSARVGQQKTFNIILCPSHITGKWVRELGETLPNSYGVVVHSITEFDKLYRLYEKGDKSVYAILSKEKARDGYMKRPAAIWSRRQKAFLCPECEQPIEVPAIDGCVHYMEKVDQLFFRKESSKNHKCARCGAPLWTAVTPGVKSDWVKIGEYGWIYRHRAVEHFGNTKNEAVLHRLQEIRQNPDAHYPTVGACRRYPLSSYIKRKYKGKIDALIVDELHQYNNDSGQGDAMGELFAVAKKVIGMTATLINGYSSGIFHLLYRSVPYLMLKDGKRHDAPNDFNQEYGVVENTYEETKNDYASNRRTHKVKTKSRQLPGVSPLVYSRFLLEHTSFLSLADMGKDLPDYEEIPVPVTMDEDVAKEYKRIEQELVKVLKTKSVLSKKILSAYLNLLTVYPDQPYDQPSVLHPETGESIVTPADLGSFDEIGPKEDAVLKIVRQKINAGERVLIYTSWVRTDSQKKLLDLLSKQGYRTEIMSNKVRPSAREDWVQKRLSAGMQVMITNPSLVETGLDLNAFTTLIFYGMGYNLFTLRQASRRSWRINQRAPRVEVYMLYYKDTMQHKAIKLMASKLAVAGLIEGNFSEEGLAAMSDVQDMTSQMAKELMLGIRDNVEDVASAFKRMAIINPNRNMPEAVSTQDNVPTLVLTPKEPVHKESEETHIARIEALLSQQPIPKHKNHKKKIVVDENQLTIFDFVA